LGGVSDDGVLDPIRNADLRARQPSGQERRQSSDRGYPGPLIFPGLAPGLAPGPERAPAPSRNAEADAGSEAPGAPGSETGTGSEPRAPGTADATGAIPGGGVTINFDGAGVADVAQSLLGDTLGLSYVIDPRAQGLVTLASATPIARKDVLPIFETAMRMVNVQMVREGNLIRLVPLNEATGSGGVVTGAGQPGFGVSIVPLRYVSATTLAKTMDNFMARPNAIRVDQARNTLLIQGTVIERRSALDAIASFDVEWLRNQSVGLYPLKSTTPETMIAELEKIFETREGGQGQGVIRFQPMSRTNGVLVVAKNPKTLERATQWVARLDRSDTSGNALRIYQLRYGNAKSVARVLNDIFVGRGGTADDAASQVAPGTATAKSRLDSLGSGNRGSSSGTTTASSGGTPGTAGTTAGFGSASADGSSGQKDGEGDKNDSSLATGSLPRGLFPNVRITANIESNAIVIYSNQEDFRIISRALHDIDLPKLQVAIEATVAEVTLTDDLQYGVQNYVASSDLNMAKDKGSGGFFPAAPAASTSSTGSVIPASFLSRVLPGFNLLLGPEGQPRVILSALSTITDVKVLSSPSLVVMDNQPAVLEVGNQIPVTTSSATLINNSGTPVVNTIEMRSTGVILKVLPRIHANGTVQLEIEQEISNVVNPNTQTLTPTISQRRIHSTVAVTSGQTVLLGGLISEQQNTTKAGIPGLNQIKYLGDILGNTSKNKQRSEIIVFIRPQVIRNGLDAKSVTEEFRERLESMRSARPVVDGNGVGARR